MKYDGAIVRAIAQFYFPLAVTFGLTLLATRPDGGGGVIAGLVVSLAVLLHALAAGAAASRQAFPPLAARAFVSVGVVLAAAGAGFVRAPFASQILEMGLFLGTIGVCALTFVVFFGRAPTLHSEDQR